MASASKTDLSPQPGRGKAWRRLAVALSLANLCHFRTWSELLTYKQIGAYLMKSNPTPVDFAAAMANVALLGGALWLAATIARCNSYGRALARWGFLIILLVPLNALRTVAVNHFPFLRRYALVSKFGELTVLVAAILLAALTLLALLRFHRQSVRVASLVLLILFPFLPLTFARGAWRAMQYDPVPFADKPMAPRLTVVNRNAPRVFWFIGDEWDQRLTFIDRLPDLLLPELDRFRARAIYASNAYPPAGQTASSMPALIIGRLLAPVKSLGPAELLLPLPSPEQPVYWSKHPNIFSRARQAGFNTALVGFYHPYPRVLNANLTACWSWPLPLQYNSMGTGFGEILANQSRSLLETDSRSPFGQALPVHEHVRIYLAGLERAKQLAADPDLGLILAHLPVPHAPHAYDRRTGQFTLKNSPVAGYYDSLALLDRTLRDLRETMERAGLWEKTTVLLSSDHWHRRANLLRGKIDHRIPFLLKLAGQQEGITYHPPFNTVLSHDLLLAILRGELSSPDQVVAWLDQHRTIADSPFNHDEL